MGDSEKIREHVLASMQMLIGLEFDELHRADRDEDERAKHRAKTSMRHTLSLLKDLHKEIEDETEGSSGSVESLSPKTRDVLAEATGNEVEGILRE